MEQETESRRVDRLVGDVLGKEIRCLDGIVGPVTELLVDPATERPSHLIWREAMVVTREVSIPIDYVERIEGNRIILRVKREAIERLPHFWTTDASAIVHVPTT